MNRLMKWVKNNVEESQNSELVQVIKAIGNDTIKVATTADSLHQTALQS
ncbi:hypothetical protein I2483_06890 [Sporosarcina sp. E16_3]|nr:hypothetical protein [Sporosarcina sp. E16_3]MBO0601383.1 hypothetical protein [Sporosarcina sp. E16_3]